MGTPVRGFRKVCEYGIWSLSVVIGSYRAVLSKNRNRFVQHQDYGSCPPLLTFHIANLKQDTLKGGLFPSTYVPSLSLVIIPLKQSPAYPNHPEIQSSENCLIRRAFYTRVSEINQVLALIGAPFRPDLLPFSSIVISPIGHQLFFCSYGSQRWYLHMRKRGTSYFTCPSSTWWCCPREPSGNRPARTRELEQNASLGN